MKARSHLMSLDILFKPPEMSYHLSTPGPLENSCVVRLSSSPISSLKLSLLLLLTPGVTSVSTSP